MMEKLVRVNAQKRERQYDDDCFTQVGFAGCRELRDRQPPKTEAAATSVPWRPTKESAAASAPINFIEGKLRPRVDALIALLTLPIHI